jgi:putative transposase
MFFITGNQLNVKTLWAPTKVERWFAIIKQRAIRRFSFSNVKEVIGKTEEFVAAYDKSKAQFKWTSTAD